MEKGFVLLSIPSSFLSLPVTTKAIESTPPCSVGKKRKTCSFSSAGSWRVLGLCVTVHRILAFSPPFSVYCAQRLHCVSVWTQTVSIYQHISLYFLFFKKEKKKLLNDGVTESQQKVGLRRLGGLSEYFDNMAIPLACLTVMFNGCTFSLRWHF